MAVVCKMMVSFSILTLLLNCVVAPPPRDLFGSHNDLSTSTQLTREENDGGNSIWEEDDDVFDLDGDSWLKETPLSTWPSLNQSPKPPDFDDDADEDNMIDDEGDDSDEDQDREEGQSEFLLVPEANVDKRNLKVRHAGRTSDSDIDDSGLVERPDDVLPDTDEREKEESYDLISYPETDDGVKDDVDDDDDTGDDDDDVDKDGDNDIFGEQDEDDSKRMFEDRVFLF